MIRFYFHPTPNPAKVALFLEEAELPYEMIPVDTSKDEQHLPAFRTVNPNGKVPAIIDTEGPEGKEARVFDSTAILLFWPRRQDSSSARQGTGRSCCPGCFLSPRDWVRFPVRPCISSSPRLRVSLTP
jgi:Glutathione S-transferase, N-terminal domain